jgi:hypothetical protein
MAGKVLYFRYSIKCIFFPENDYSFVSAEKLKSKEHHQLFQQGNGCTSIMHSMEIIEFTVRFDSLLLKQ